MRTAHAQILLSVICRIELIVKCLLLTHTHNAHILYALYMEDVAMKAFNSQAPKKATNLSINSDLLAKARELNINLSATLETALAELLKAKQRDQWLKENSSAIEAYNEFVEKEGAFSDDIRSF